MKITSSSNFDIVIIGAGANGSHLLRNLLQDMASYGSKLRGTRVLIADGDRVEKKNFLNQLYDEEDLDEFKVSALADRYGIHYGIDVLAVPEYITDIDKLHKLFANDNRFKILVGAVDNNRTRQLMNDYFNFEDDLLYLDVGVEGVILKEELKGKGISPEQSNRMIMRSGFSGQVVAGLKAKGEVILPPLCDVYPNVLSDTESIFPTEDCAEVINNPQRLETNKFAAQVVNIIINNLFHTGELYQHEIIFNARLGASNVKQIDKQIEEYFNELMQEKSETAQAS